MNLPHLDAVTKVSMTLLGLDFHQVSTSFHSCGNLSGSTFHGMFCTTAFFLPCPCLYKMFFLKRLLSSPHLCISVPSALPSMSNQGAGHLGSPACLSLATKRCYLTGKLRSIPFMPSPPVRSLTFLPYYRCKGKR